MRPRLPVGLDLQKSLNSLDDFRIVRWADITRKAAFDVGVAVLRPVALIIEVASLGAVAALDGTRDEAAVLRKLIVEHGVEALLDQFRVEGMLG